MQHGQHPMLKPFLGSTLALLLLALVAGQSAQQQQQTDDRLHTLQRDWAAVAADPGGITAGEPLARQPDARQRARRSPGNPSTIPRWKRAARHGAPPT